jgi:hypothetical protein
MRCLGKAFMEECGNSVSFGGKESPLVRGSAAAWERVSPTSSRSKNVRGWDRKACRVRAARGKRMRARKIGKAVVEFRGREKKMHGCGVRTGGLIGQRGVTRRKAGAKHRLWGWVYSALASWTGGSLCCNVGPTWKSGMAVSRPDGKEIVPLKHLQANETARSLEGRFGLWPFSTERLARIIEPWRL